MIKNEKRLNLQEQTVVIRPANIEDIIQLRHDVLIVGTDRASPEFDGDPDESTRHFGAFINEEIVSCLSWMRSEFESQPAWQLRGMATQLNFRGTGVGRELLDYSESQIASESGIMQFWCNARSGAVGFYQKQGWQTCSDEFVISGVGPHFKMKKTYRAND